MTAAPDGASPADASPADASPADGGTTVIAEEIRRILAAATGRVEMLDLPAGMPLFGPPVALDSLTGTLLLREIRSRFGVDLAAEDLNLDALATLATLAGFVGERVAGGLAGPG